MTRSDLDLLPPDLAALSADQREIALPYPAVLRAIEHLERTGVRILGWEVLRSTSGGGRPYELLQGSGDSSPLHAAAAAAVTRREIQAALADPHYRAGDLGTVLYFIITVADGLT